MTQMTTKQARGGVEPFLTEIARGYNAPQDMVGSLLFPRVPVRSRAGRIITFGKEAYMQYGNLRRAPGQNTKRVAFGYEGAPFVLNDYSLEGQVPYETQQEAEQVPGIDIGEHTVAGVQLIMATRLEVEQATLATTAANYGSSNKVALSGTAQWSDPDDSDPIGDIEAAKEAIRAQTGHYPNVMVLGAAVAAKLRRNASIIEQLSTATAGPTRPMINEAILSAIFDIPNVRIGRAVTASDAGVFSDIWGKKVVLAYTNLAPMADKGTPSYGYTYQLEGMPLVEEPYADRNAKSWLYPVDDAVAPVIAGAESGFLINDAVA